MTSNTTTTTTSTPTTIGELNAALGVRVSPSWQGWTEHRELRLGRAGQQNARRGTAGAKLHLLDVDIVIAKPADASKHSHKVGAYSSVRGCVSSNGQYTGVVVEGAVDLAAVDCTRCRRRLDALLAKLAPVVASPTYAIEKHWDGNECVTEGVRGIDVARGHWRWIVLVNGEVDSTHALRREAAARVDKLKAAAAK